MLATLRQRNFALVWWAGLISVTGDRILSTALPFYVYHQTGSTLATATIVAVNILPSFALSSIAGVFVDRWDRRQTMLVANLARAAILLPMILVRSAESIWIVYVVAALEASFSTFFRPAENALLPQLVGKQHLLSANSLNALNNNLARLIGPPIGGLLIGLFGLSSIVLLDSLSYMIAGTLLLCMSNAVSLKCEVLQGSCSTRPTKTDIWREWHAGLRYVRQVRTVALLFVITGIITFGGTMIDPLIVPFMNSVVRSDALGFGWLLTTQAIGGLLGGIIIGQWGHVLHPVRLLALSNIGIGSLLLAMYNVPLLPVVLTLSFLIGVVSVGSGTSLQTLLQRNVPDKYRGRVFGALGTISALLELVSVGLAGVLGDWVGIVPMLNVAGAITVFAGVVTLLLLPQTTLDYETDERVYTGQ